MLVGRHALPPREAWPRWLARTPRRDRTSRRLRAVEALEAAGAEVLVAAADVLDPGSAARGDRRRRSARFGALHGVFHAAGVLDDALLETKTRPRAERVLAPKVHGTLVLDAALAGTPARLPAALLVASARSPGLPGQIDYTAANAFLDAFAQHRSAREAAPTISVGWGAWQEVGIAAELARRAAGREAEATRAPTPAHPLLERCLRDDGSRQVFATRFGPATHWLLDEHRVAGGPALIPGHRLPRARARRAGRARRGRRDRDPRHLPDGALRGGGRRDPRAARRDRPHERRFQHRERRRGRRQRAPSTCAEPRSGSRRDSPDKRSLDELRARCQARTLTFDGTVPQAHLRFGPRWSCVRSIALRRGRGGRRARAGPRPSPAISRPSVCIRRCSTWRPAARTR